MYTDHAITCEVVMLESNSPQIDALPEWFGDGSCQKKKIEETLRQSCMTDHTLTRKFVALKIKCRQIDTITQ